MQKLDDAERANAQKKEVIATEDKTNTQKKEVIATKRKEGEEFDQVIATVEKANAEKIKTIEQLKQQLLQAREKKLGRPLTNTEKEEVLKNAVKKQ